MVRSKLMRTVLVVGSVLIIVGVSLMTWILVTDSDQNVIKVDLGDGNTQSVKFEKLSLVPGGSCEYTVELKNDRAKKYDVSLDFVETEEKTLKNYARVRIETNGGETVCDELLATVLENGEIVIPVDFTEKKNTELKIVYYLPIEVGNEAKNAEAIFELLLTASNE